MSIALRRREAPATTSPDASDTRHFPARLASGPAILGRRAGANHLRLRLAGEDVAADFLSDESGQGRLILPAPFGDAPNAMDLLASLIEAAFQHDPACCTLMLPGLAGKSAIASLSPRHDMVDGIPAAIIRRSDFYQLPLLWRSAQAHATLPLIRSDLGPQDRLPPLRAPKPRGVMYQRWLPHLGMTLSLRPIDRRRDLELFHGWMNQPRVAFFWELAQSRADLDRYLAAQEADPHIFGVIGSFDDEPVGYFEFYWAKEDRLGPFYDAEDYDRGWHGLIGNARHLGRIKTLAWFRSLTHYLFLDDPRTQRIVGEPRASHHKMLSYCADVAYEKVKEFDFPHKRAALVCCERERFFRQVIL